MPSDAPVGADPLKSEAHSARNELIKTPLKVENGFIIIPDAPGIGVELVDDVEKKFPWRRRKLATRHHADGSVVDQ